MSLARRLGRLETAAAAARSDADDSSRRYPHGGEQASLVRAFRLLVLWDDLRREEQGLPPAAERTWPPTTEEALQLIGDAYREANDGDSRQLTELIARRNWPPDATEG